MTALVDERPAGPDAVLGTPAASMDPVASVRGVSVVYGERRHAVRALDGISLDITPGEFVCVVGASGCGKSTLLNLLAGLDDPTTGSLVVDGPTSLMFQEAALFPWLTARGNVELALRLDGVARRDRRAQAEALLQTVHLESFAEHRPHELSGGMRQRVALARALARRCELLLMDEPFGALDAMTRDLLHDELERIWTERRCAVLFVTHNVREAVRLADRVVLLSSRPGRVVGEFDIDLERPRRIGSPEVAAMATPIADRLRKEVARHGAR